MNFVTRKYDILIHLLAWCEGRLLLSGGQYSRKQELAE